MGLLELPLSPDHAESIYDAGCKCCEDLVNLDVTQSEYGIVILPQRRQASFDDSIWFDVDGCQSPCPIHRFHRSVR